MTRLFTEYVSGGSEMILLLVIAYDCYVTICMPLHYLVIMKQRFCFVLQMVSWVVGFLHSVIQLSTIYWLLFCGTDVIDHFMCDMFPLLKLICTDTYVTGILMVVNGVLICSISFLLLFIYFGVILYFLKNLSQEGKEESPPDLWLPPHCCCLLYSLYFHVCKTY